ncbi:MAG: sodium:calcium antiporter [Cyanobium sp.]
MTHGVALLLGVLCAGLGGELFVRGAVGLGHWARIPPGTIGATVAAFATSSPELSVAVQSALAGTPQIALGDALGSNVVNLCLILALPLLMAGLQVPRQDLQRDRSVVLVAPALTALLLIDGELSRGDGCLMLLLFVVWLWATVRATQRQRSSAEEVLGAHRHGLILASCLLGLALLVAAGFFIVVSAEGLARSFGVPDYLVGATVVALGTSMPELATTVIAKLRGHDEVGLATILGSNIFNNLFIVSIAAILHPIPCDGKAAAIALTFAVLAVLVATPSRSGWIGRWQGGGLLLLYAIYLVFTLA